MSFTVNKSTLVQPIKDFYFPISKQQVTDETIADIEHPDTKLVDFCRQLFDDVEWMFRYTNDGENWTHVSDLSVTNPFPGFLSVDTIASDGVANFLYERAERYFKQNLIRTDELDWFYLDFIVAVGYRVLLKKFGEKDFQTALPVISKAIEEFDGSKFWPLAKYLLKVIVKNIVFFGFVLFLLSVALDGSSFAGLVSAGLLVWKLYSWYSPPKLYSKLMKASAEKLSHFSALYNLFASGHVRWDLLEHDMKRLRDLSIEFPLVLDTAVTARKKLS